MAKIPVEFTGVHGSFVKGDRAAFSAQKVVALVAKGVARRMTAGEVAQAHAERGTSSAPLDEVPALKARLDVAALDIKTAQDGAAKALKDAETARRERDQAIVEATKAKADLAAMTAQAAEAVPAETDQSAGGAADADPAATDSAAATTKTTTAKTAAKTNAGAPPAQGATK